MKYNFNSGPGVLPKQVFEEASQAVLDFNGSGLSILEIGHRTPLFVDVLDEARAAAKTLMQLDDDHEVLFLHGGATTHFMQVPMNLLGTNGMAAYVDGGTWGTKAIKEAQLFGRVEVVGSSAQQGYTCLPKDYTVPPEASYLHLTSNNTIEGTQIHHWPQTDVPVVCDMSSDILSRELDFNRFGLIYAGAQKNMGAAGVSMVVVNKHILGKTGRAIPTIMDYRQHIANGSLLNTPPVFAVYVCLLTLRWLLQQGGIAAIAPQNEEKANLLYDTLDTLPLFTPTVAKADRSLMNVVWIMDNKMLEQEFLDLATQEGMVGIQGHRTAGGFRASLYNALPLQSVQVLVQLLTHFAQKKG
ncbi:MAG: 3-phosphoserine/phosphohydroxythreonine transaminase [Bacteroidetes bacterium]|nr:MAG: 3-phosphoserine/phosphohydroxythreonine transaminase [Bacteroidota bacterium]